MPRIIVGMADLRITRSPDILATIGLGSCVGIAMYDPTTKIAGLAHIMLPESINGANEQNPAKFADTAVTKMLNDMEKMGAMRRRIWAKIVGGAQMFNFGSTNDNLRVGDRNIRAVKNALNAEHIPIKGDETGGTFGRTMEVDAEDGKVLIKAIDQENRYI